MHFASINLEELQTGKEAGSMEVRVLQMMIFARLQKCHETQCTCTVWGGADKVEVIALSPFHPAQ